MAHRKSAAAAGSGDEDAVCGAGHGCVIVAQVADGGFGVHNHRGGVADIGAIDISHAAAAGADAHDDVARLERRACLVTGAGVTCAVRDWIGLPCWASSRCC